MSKNKQIILISAKTQCLPFSPTQTPLHAKYQGYVSINHNSVTLNSWKNLSFCLQVPNLADILSTGPDGNYFQLLTKALNLFTTISRMQTHLSCAMSGQTDHFPTLRGEIDSPNGKFVHVKLSSRQL